MRKKNFCQHVRHAVTDTVPHPKGILNLVKFIGASDVPRDREREDLDGEGNVRRRAQER
jgi:hypothetical protein